MYTYECIHMYVHVYVNPKHATTTCDACAPVEQIRTQLRLTYALTTHCLIGIGRTLKEFSETSKQGLLEIFVR